MEHAGLRTLIMMLRHTARARAKHGSRRKVSEEVAKALKEYMTEHEMKE